MAAPASDERLDGAEAERFITACVAIARQPVHEARHTEAAIRALDVAYTERPVLPAPTLVLDAAVLLRGLQPVASPLPVPNAVREVVRGYEDHVLARLGAERRWTRLVEAVLAAPVQLRAAAVGLTVTRWLTRWGVTGGTGISHVVLRRFIDRPAGEVIDAGIDALTEPLVVERVVAGLTRVVQAARRMRELLADSDISIVENIGALQSLGARVSLAQLADAAQVVESALPTRLRTPVTDDGTAATSLEEDSAYPLGGFSSVSTIGSLENLVTSELIYMDEGAELRPDLFDVRFVESELLYYARDEAVAVRRRRALVLVFDGTLVSARVLDAGERFQRLVWLLAAVTALVRKLSAWLDTEALTFELVFVGDTPEVSLREEAGVVSLLLREYRERGQVDVRTAGGVGEAVSAARHRHRDRAHVLLFATKVTAGLDGDSRPDAIIDVGQRMPRVHWLDARPPDAHQPETTAEAWAVTTRALLDGVLRGPRRAGIPTRRSRP
ncbi:MAG: hypothetical protein JNG84_00775 [Archangium sp.]|nr:hypothetical protein [Archangium sp.]